jgi:serine/threonine protein kinase/tetratricopeptide (TPR) repeat protein
MNETATAGSGSALKSRYVLHERLGLGGQGEVWRAHDPERDMDIALKILRPGAGRSEAAWEALQHEYQSASRLDHPYILKVYPPERHNSDFLLPMELVTGGDLARLRGASYLAIVPVLIEVAEALGHAHERGVIHRDLKASNVLLDARGRVQLADFGVSGRSPDPGTDAMIRGLSPFTASPEQLRGEPPQPADDIYGLGALAYELLSGHPPYYPHFDARRVQEEPVPPLNPTQQIPPQLNALITGMLSKHASDRPASMSEVCEGFHASLNDTLTFDSPRGASARGELPANATVQLPGGEPLPAALAGNATIQLDDPSQLDDSSANDEFADGLPASEPELPAVAPVPTMARSAAAPMSARVMPHALTATEPAQRSATARPYVPPMRPVWQRAPLPGQPMRAKRHKAPTVKSPPRTAPAPEPSGPGALDVTVWQELRHAPVRAPRLEPMRSVLPRVVLVLFALVAVGVALATLLPRFDAATPAAALARAEAIVREAVDSARSASPADAHAPSAATLPVAVAGAAEAPSAAHAEVVKASFNDDGYAQAAGEGFAALGAGRLNEARASFDRARALRPDGAEAQEGLRRVAAASSVRSFGAMRTHAQDLEADERWEDALDVYRSVLRQDRSQEFAQAGKARAEARLQLDGSLQELLDHPERLSSPNVREEATRLLQTAAEESSPGPVLSSQVARLTALLPGMDQVVRVSLVSDSLTQVAIPGVGTFGSFSQRDVQLRPGHYTVIGTRDGFRDVQREITVSPGQENQTVKVSCDESS